MPKVAAFLLLCVFLLPGLASAATPPRPDHTVILMLENKNYNSIIGNTTDAPYINSLANQGAVMTQSYGIGHPSSVNFLHLFSGSPQGYPNLPPMPLNTPNFAAQLLAAGRTFAAFCEDLPAVGSLVNSAGLYLRDFAPWTNWINAAANRLANQLPPEIHRPFTDFPSDYNQLPDVSFVIPNTIHNMHDGPTLPDQIRPGDQWAQANIDGYVQWAKTHNSLLIIHFDEDEFTPVNHIPTIFVGPMIQPGEYSQLIDHYNILRTLEDMHGLAPIGGAATAAPITDVFVPEPAGFGLFAAMFALSLTRRDRRTSPRR